MAYLLFGSALFAFMITVQIQSIVIYANNFSRLRYFDRNSRFDVISLAALALMSACVVFASREVKGNEIRTAAAEFVDRRGSGKSALRTSMSKNKRASMADSGRVGSSCGGGGDSGDDASETAALSSECVAISEGDEASHGEAPTTCLTSSSLDSSFSSFTGYVIVARAAATDTSGAAIFDAHAELNADNVSIRVDGSAAASASFR
jgi:hypothetical protein